MKKLNKDYSSKLEKVAEIVRDNHSNEEIQEQNKIAMRYDYRTDREEVQNAIDKILELNNNGNS